MSLDSEVTFEVTLRDFIKSHFPKIDVEPPAISIISKMLKGFNNEFITEMLAYKKMPLLNAAQSAVEKKLPKSLKKLALAEAHRQLALFELGYSEYDDLKKVDTKVKKSVKTPGTKRPSDSKASGKTTSAKSKPKSISSAVSKKRKRSVVVKKTKKFGQKKASSKKQKASNIRKASLAAKKPKKVKKEKKERADGFELMYNESPTSVFKVGILKLHSLTHSTMKIDKDALEYLSACLYYFSKTMAVKLSEKFPKTEIEPKYIKDALAEYSGPNLHKTAISEGIKSVTLFMNGLLPFKMDSSKKEPPMKGESFRAGIELFLEKEFFEPIRLDPDSSEYLEHLLMEFLTLFASDAGDICLRHKIRVMSDNELKMVAEDILAEELRCHAMIRGDKAVSDFQRGLRQYSQPDTKGGGLSSGTSEKKKNSLLEPKPKKRPKLDAKSTAKPTDPEETDSKTVTSEAEKSSKVSKKNPKRKNKKASKKIKGLVSKVLKKK